MKKFGFNQFQIKIFMALLMVTDHLSLVPGLISDDLIGIFHILTRCVAVWSCRRSTLYPRYKKIYIPLIWGGSYYVFGKYFTWVFICLKADFDF